MLLQSQKTVTVLSDFSCFFVVRWKMFHMHLFQGRCLIETPKYYYYTTPIKFYTHTILLFLLSLLLKIQKFIC